MEDQKGLGLNAFVNRYSLEVCIRFLLLGFELELYAKVCSVLIDSVLRCEKLINC